MKPVLWYAHDPMCPYCYAFNNTWDLVQKQLKDIVEICYLVGGMAPDSNDPMSQKMLIPMKNTWRKIHKQYCVSFNHNFFKNNIPRRSTYMACRAVLVAKKYHLQQKMIQGIQTAYYLNAKNPADIITLVDIAENLGIDADKFKSKLLSNKIEELLQADIRKIKQLGMDSFPSLLLVNDNKQTQITIDYSDSKSILTKIQFLLNC